MFLFVLFLTKKLKSFVFFMNFYEKNVKIRKKVKKTGPKRVLTYQNRVFSRFWTFFLENPYDIPIIILGLLEKPGI